MTIVKLRPNESQEQLLKRFRKKVTKDGLMSTVRRKRWYVTKSELRRIEKKKAIPTGAAQAAQVAGPLVDVRALFS